MFISSIQINSLKSLDYIYRTLIFFGVSQILQKWGISVTFIICVNHFLRSKKFHKENDNGYNLCVIDYLQFKRDQGKNEN